MYVVSFYSFKGGVGRTVTLLNTAWHLANRGHRVALLDLDLEAPGLQAARLLERQAGDWIQPPIRKGFVDLLDAFGSGAGTADWPAAYLATNLGPEGRIALLAAHGATSMEDVLRYEHFVQTFSWASFYLEANGRGFMEALVRGIAQQGYDYLFIDARTGLTDVAGITLQHLPDLVVLVTNLSDQSVRGIKTQLDAIDRVNVECATKEGSVRRRSGSRHQTIASLVVASPLPRGEWKMRQAGLRNLESVLNRRIDIQVDYLPLLALDEENHIPAQHIHKEALHTDELLAGATRAWERLADAIITRNPEALENVLREGDAFLTLGRWREALAHFDEVCDRAKAPGQEGLARDAKAFKVRAQLAALNVDDAIRLLDEMATPVKGADLARLRMAASWTLVLRNLFSKAVEQARLAKQETLKNAEQDTTVDKALLAKCQLFLGQALLLDGRQSEALVEFNDTVHLCEELGTLPLLECLSRAELIRAQVLVGPLSATDEQLTRAWRQSGWDRAVESDERPPFAVVSNYVQARLYQARADVRCELGKGISAQADLKSAFTNFETEGDDLGCLEIALSLATLGSQLPVLRSHAAQTASTAPTDRWAIWMEMAGVLRTPRLSARLDLQRRMQARKRYDAKPAVSEETDYEFHSMLRLEEARTLLGGDGSQKDIAAALRNAEQVMARPGRSFKEAAHQLCLIRTLAAIAFEASWHNDFQKHVTQLRNDGYALRHAQASLVMAIGDIGSPRASQTLAQLQLVLGSLEEPREWLWQLPLAFIERASSPSLSARWQNVRPHIDSFWPRPRAE